MRPATARSAARPPWAHAALSHPCFTGISRQHLGELVAELADPWTASHEAALQQRRGHRRQRAVGAGPKRRLAFCDRVLVTLVHLRLQLPHQALAVLFGVDRRTVTRAIGEVRPLLAQRGFAVPGQPGLRLRTLADVVAYANACGWSCAWTHRDPDPPPPRPPTRPAGVRVGQTQAKHHEGCRGWPPHSLSRSPPRPASRPRTPPPRWWMPTGRPAPGSPPSGSAWNMRSLSTSSDGPCSAISAAGSPSARPTWRSRPDLGPGRSTLTGHQQGRSAHSPAQSPRSIIGNLSYIQNATPEAAKKRAGRAPPTAARR